MGDDEPMTDDTPHHAKQILAYGRELASGRMKPLGRREIEARYLDDLDDDKIRGLDKAWTAFRRDYAWSIPCREAITAIASFSDRTPILEIGAGTGLWSALLAREGRDTVASDVVPQGTIAGAGQTVGRWHQTLALGAADAVRMMPERNILLAWPTYDRPWAADAIDTVAPGRLIHSIGEEDGCTGDARMRESLITRCRKVAWTANPNFPGLHSHLAIYEKI